MTEQFFTPSPSSEVLGQEKDGEVKIAPTADELTPQAHHLEYIVKEIQAQTNHDLIKLYGEQYGADNVGWEFDPATGESFPTHLKLNDVTRQPTPIEWQVDPGRDIVAHHLSTWDVPTQGMLNMDKKSHRFGDIVSSIKRFGHLSPNNYDQLATTNSIGHPTGNGPQAVFVFQTPNVAGWEHNRRFSKVGNPFNYRSSALEISVTEAQTAHDGQLAPLVEEFTAKAGKPFSALSFVPPERVQGVLLFSNKTEYERFDDTVDILKFNFISGHSKFGTELAAIEQFVRENLAVTVSEKWQLVRSKVLKLLTGNSQLEDIIATKRKTLFLYGAMITRDTLKQLCQAIHHNIHKDQMAGTQTKQAWLEDMAVRIGNYAPSFAATQHLQAETLATINTELAKLKS